VKICVNRDEGHAAQERACRHFKALRHMTYVRKHRNPWPLQTVETSCWGPKRNHPEERGLALREWCDKAPGPSARDVASKP